ncbi:hypothetical protein MMA231_03414 [Asticcacaulis sp. MM231]|uniref:hypothetical protein n=1 Tax=Asticcacaulis sp. MM231 TaxID=3157666 RepID=UPI0032D576C6
MSEQQNLTQLIEHYLGFILSPERIGEDGGVKTDALMRILDQLAIRTHDKSGIIPDNEGEDEVRLDYQDTYKSLTQHFPDYSYYSTVLDINDAVKDYNLAAADPLVLRNQRMDSLDLANMRVCVDGHGQKAVAVA